MGNFKLFLGLIKSRKMKIGSSRPRMFLRNKLVYPLPISAASVTCNSAVYNGSKQVAQNIVVKLNGETLDGTLDYTVTVNNGGTNVGSYPVTVLGINNFDSVANGTFSITPDGGRVTTAPSPKNLIYNATAQELVTAGSGTGTMMYSLDNSTWSISIPKGTNATSYTVYYKAAASANYTESSVGSVNVSIAKVTPTVTPPSRKSLTYNGNPQAIANTGSTNYGTLQYSLDNSTWSTSMPTRTDAGTYILYYRVVGNMNINDVPSASIETSIGKADPSYTAPTKRNFTYDGNAQNLLNAGSTSHGTIQYSVNNSTWSTTIPTATNVGTYNAWWRLVGDSNHNDVSSTKISDITVSKVTPTVTAPTPRTLTFNGSNQVLANNGSTDFGTMKYCLNNSGGTYSTSVPSASAATTYTVWYKVEGNSNVENWGPASITCSINNSSPTTLTITLSPNSYTYSGNECRPSVTVRDGSTVIPSSEYSVVYSNNTNAGTATVTVVDNAGGNYNVSGSTTFIINKVTPTVTAPTPITGLVYDNTAKVLANAGSTNWGTMKYSTSQTGAYSTTIPSQVGAGQYTVWYKVEGDSNINDYGPYSILVSISKADGTATVNGVNTTYDGTGKYLVTVSNNTGTMHYKVGSGAWSTTMPYFTNATDTLTIYWYMDESANYGGIPSANTRYVTSSIAKADQEAPTATGATATYPTTATASASGGGRYGSLEWESSQSQSSVGSHTTRARWSGNANYNASPWSNYVTVQMNKASRTLSWTSAPTDMEAGDSITVAAAPSAGSGDGTITYTSSDSNVASVEGNSVTAIDAGTCIITATISEGTNYLSASVTAEITIEDSSSMGHAYVEIGGLKWATMNIGATSVTDYGQYFQWGDTTGYKSSDVGSQSTSYKKPFAWNDYKFDNGSNGQATGLTKYNANDSKAVLDLCDDAARLNWGGGWRMPTTAEFKALGNAVNTAWTASYQGSGVAGLVCTDKTDSSKVLFFPAAGRCSNRSVNDVGSNGRYWSSSLSSNNMLLAYYLSFYSYFTNWGYDIDRYFGFPIRGVLGKKKTNPNILTAPKGRVGLVYNGNLQYLLEGGTADVAGTFDYERQTNAGTYNALWIFYPTDLDNYNTVRGTITVSIAKLTPTITATPTAKSGLKYNGSSQELLEGGTANVGGTFTYSTASAAGTHTASWTFTSTDSVNYNTVTGGGISVSIAKADGYAIVYGESYTYDGSSHSLVYVYGNTGTMHYKVGSSGSWSTSIPYATSLGTYYIYWYMDESDNYNGIASSSTRYVTSYIEDKTFPTITSSPTARTGLKYTGSAQYLLEGGSANVSGSFSYDTGTNAGTYDAYWTFNPNDTSSYYSVTGGPVSATIAKATPVITETPYSNGAIYNGNSQPLLAGGSANVSGTFSYEYATDAGTYSSAHWAFTPSDTTNYEPEYGTASGTIYKANQSAPTAYGDTATYGSTATATASGGGGYGTLTWTNGNTLSEVGYKDTAAYWSGDGNHNASPESNTVRLEVNKATPTIISEPQAKTGLEYNGSSQTLLSGGSANVSGSFIYGSGTNAGTYTTGWKFTPTDTSRYKEVSGTAQATIAKKGRTVTWASSTSAMTVGDTITLSLTVSEGSDDGNIIFVTSDSSKASINGTTLKAMDEGTVVISGTITGGTNYKDASTSFILTVNPDVRPTIVINTPSGKYSPQLIFMNTDNQSEVVLGTEYEGGTFEVTWTHGGTVNVVTWSNNTSSVPYITIYGDGGETILSTTRLTGAWGNITLTRSFSASDYQSNAKTLTVSFTDIG